MTSSYEISVQAKGRKTALLRYTGPVADVALVAVARDNGTLRLTYGVPGAPVVLDEGKDPGGPLELVRQRQAEGAKEVRRAVG